LSYLTKLNNNQLLALPLAINLDRNNLETSSSKSSTMKDQDKLSDIKQVVIKSGQVLKVCGVYEDVLPLIEGKHQAELKRKERFAHHDQRSIQPHQMAAHSSLLYQPINTDHLYHQAASAGYRAGKQPKQAGRKNQRLLKLRQVGKPEFQQQASGHYAASPLIYGAPSGPLMSGLGGQAETQVSYSQQAPSTGQRYARCILLSRKSLDQLTSCSLVASAIQGHEQQAEPEPDEAEVLIPIEQRGRFYLCATSQSMVNELHCYRCNGASSPNLVFRLSQIISLLSVGKRLSERSTRGQQQQPARHRQHRWPMNGQCEPNVIKLPLTMRLVVGPRPVNFSPSMFGSSSTMESYFKSEANVGGHSLECRFNKNFALAKGAAEGQVSEASQEGVQGARKPSGPVCSCALKLVKMEADSGGQGCGLFSAVLRIERMSKRDVLLACTIKKDPLLRLNLFTDDHSKSLQAAECRSKAAGSLMNQNNLFRQHSTLAADQLHCERLAIQERCHQPDKQVACDAKSINKSSFSRLRACRSLISLNGRRKRRPNIPSSMMAANNWAPCELPPGGASGRQFGDSSSLSAEERPIVIVEFDCNDSELRFARTFVESSIPTSVIPDLVLNRVEFCQRNSPEWERQLKLSYKTLSQDFDSCRRQMEQNRKRALERHLSARRANLPASEPYEASLPALLVATSGCVDSTASSRSSSGVSSAGGRDKRQLDGRATDSPSSKHEATSKSGSSSCSNNNVAASTSGSSATSSSTSITAQQSSRANSSRLLRLVHKILPPFQAKPQPGDGARNSQRRVMEELSGKLRQQSLAGDREQAGAEIASRTDDATLMNAQKIHRKLTTGCARHLVRAARSNSERMSEEETTTAAGSGDSSSHLYESLERLNEDLGRRVPRKLERLHFSKSPKLTAYSAKGNRRLAIGKSIEFLVGGGAGSGRLNAFVCRSSGRPNNSSGAETEADEDEWWHSSTCEPAGAIQSGGQLATRARLKIGATCKSAGSPGCSAMEPVSIESCNDEFMSMVLDGDCDADQERAKARSVGSELSLASEAGWRPQLGGERACRSLIGQLCDIPNRSIDGAENIYMNLPGIRESRSSSEVRLQAAASSRQRLAGRMERKLMKIRGRQRGAQMVGAKCEAGGWSSERELSPLELDGQERFARSGFHSIGLSSEGGGGGDDDDDGCADEPGSPMSYKSREGRQFKSDYLSQRALAGSHWSRKSVNSLAPVEFGAGRAFGARPAGGAGVEPGRAYNETINSFRSGSSFESSGSSSLSSTKAELVAAFQRSSRSGGDSSPASSSSSLAEPRLNERRACCWPEACATQIPFRGGGTAVGQVTGGGRVTGAGACSARASGQPQLQPEQQEQQQQQQSDGSSLAQASQQQVKLATLDRTTLTSKQH